MLAPALVFLGIREFGLLVATWMASVNGFPRVSDVLREWDGNWFLGIAQTGYSEVPSGLYDLYTHRPPETTFAFFPGYPTLIRWVAAADGPGGTGLVTAGLTITIVSGVVCAYGLMRLARLVNGGSRRAGLVLVALFAASPMAIVLSMVYSEALFCALAIWALVGVLERRWVLAGVLCAFAGLVRPTAAALILAIGMAVLFVVIKKWDDWRPWVGGLLAPVGLVGYLGYVAAQRHDLVAWFRIQHSGWGSGFDGGWKTWTTSVEYLAQSRETLEIVTVGLIITSLVLAVICIVRRLEWPLLVYGLAVLVMDLGASGLVTSKVRLMVPAFTLLIPVAIALAKRRTSTVVVTLCGLMVASSWFGAYAITGWNFAI
jgi:hypothetical protein